MASEDLEKKNIHASYNGTFTVLYILV